MIGLNTFTFDIGQSNPQAFFALILIEQVIFPAILIQSEGRLNSPRWLLTWPREQATEVPLHQATWRRAGHGRYVHGVCSRIFKRKIRPYVSIELACTTRCWYSRGVSTWYYADYSLTIFWSHYRCVVPLLDAVAMYQSGSALVRFSKPRSLASLGVLWCSCQLYVLFVAISVLYQSITKPRTLACTTPSPWDTLCHHEVYTAGYCARLRTQKWS